MSEVAMSQRTETALEGQIERVRRFEGILEESIRRLERPIARLNGTDNRPKEVDIARPECQVPEGYVDRLSHYSDNIDECLAKLDNLISMYEQHL